MDDEPLLRGQENLQVKQVINHRQIAWLTSGVIMTGAVVSLPQQLAVVAKNDAWLSQLLPVMYTVLVAYVFERLIRAYPGKNIFEILIETRGRVAGSLFNGILLLFFLLILLRDIKGVGHFLHLSLLSETPLEIILLVFVVVLQYFGRSSMEVAARVNEMYFPMFFILSFSMYFILSNEYDLRRLEPIMDSKFVALLLSNWMSGGLYGDIFVFGAFLHAISQSRLFFSAVKHGATMAGFGIMLILIIQLGVMGYLITSRLNYPVYVLVEQIHLTDFLDRVEVMLFSIWFPAFAIKVVITYLTLLIGIGTLTRREDYTYCNGPFGWFVLILSITTFQHINDVNNFIGFVLPVLVPLIQWPMLLLLFLSARQKAGKRAGSDQGSHPLLKKYRRYTRLWWICFAICTISLLIGSFIEPFYGGWGRVFGAVYFFGFLAAFIFSYLELQSLNHIMERAKSIARRA
jgi:spore germination protein (amino acid permease)